MRALASAGERYACPRGVMPFVTLEFDGTENGDTWASFLEDVVRNGANRVKSARTGLVGSAPVAVQ
jgi:hypothetical protein